MKYFRSFPIVRYDTLGDGVLSSMTDFTPNFKVRNANLIKNLSYMNYTIGDGERPDITSHMLYGTTAYHWTFFVINDKLRKGISEWPLSQYQLDSFISSKYGKYACITFDPTQTPHSLSYIPFEKYADSLYLAYDTEGGIAYRKIVGYDTLTCQMTIERANPVLDVSYDQINVSISTFISQNSYRIVSTNESFIDEIDAVYQSTNAEDYSYNVALDAGDNNLNYELMKNATYQFYKYEENTEEPVSLSTYDVIAGNTLYPNVNRITYEEMEEIVNNKKRTISVINPAYIAKFAASYFTALNNG